jgi:hypothetical protein
MMYRAGWCGAIAGPPTAGLLSAARVVPWWACLACVLAWLVVYICRLILAYRLGAKALAKAGPAQVPAVMEAIADRPRPRREKSR